MFSLKGQMNHCCRGNNNNHAGKVMTTRNINYWFKEEIIVFTFTLIISLRLLRSLVLNTSHRNHRDRLPLEHRVSQKCIVYEFFAWVFLDFKGEKNAVLLFEPLSAAIREELFSCEVGHDHRAVIRLKILKSLCAEIWTQQSITLKILTAKP